MRMRDNNPWRTRPQHQGHVDIGTHHLWASVAGPVRGKDDVLLIFITGAGASSSVYIKLQQQLSTSVRVLFYDRAGYDRSTLPEADKAVDKRILASDTARDLQTLLTRTQLEPPYVVVAHSFGGIIARSFLTLHKEEVHVIAGMMLLDSATELMLAFFPRVPSTELMAVARNVDWEALTNLRQESGMTDDEWNYAIEAQKRCIDALKMEDTHASARQLASELQLDNATYRSQPLSVTRGNIAKDYKLMYDAGVALGDGTEEERRKSREFIEAFRLYHDQLARAQCTLSRDVTYEFIDASHDLPIRNPGLVVEEVKKLLYRVDYSRFGTK